MWDLIGDRSHSCLQSWISNHKYCDTHHTWQLLLSCKTVQVVSRHGWTEFWFWQSGPLYYKVWDTSMRQVKRRHTGRWRRSLTTLTWRDPNRARMLLPQGRQRWVSGRMGTRRTSSVHIFPSSFCFPGDTPLLRELAPECHDYNYPTLSVETCVSLMGLSLIWMVRSVETKRMRGTRGTTGEN